jgi:hypothetical protein
LAGFEPTSKLKASKTLTRPYKFDKEHAYLLVQGVAILESLNLCSLIEVSGRINYASHPFYWAGKACWAILAPDPPIHKPK